MMKLNDEVSMDKTERKHRLSLSVRHSLQDSRIDRGLNITGYGVLERGEKNPNCRG